jgi:beta-fructofuranosidase
MTFSLETHWVWDFWIADDGGTYHLFYLHAPKSLGDPELRHRNARIGRATSTDLRSWVDHGQVLGPGEPGSFDASATWTGSVVRGDDGLWRMFYTGSVFPSSDSSVNIESVGMATSADLASWTKRDGFVLRAAGEHYEKLGDSDWPEEAWRDPWVFRDRAGDGWHMLITARAKGAVAGGGGVIGHAWSADLEEWVVLPPLSAPSRDFPHLEVLQVADIDGVPTVVFCASRRHSAGDDVSEYEGVWAISGSPLEGILSIDDARLIAPAPLYAGKVVEDRRGRSVLLAFVGSPGTTQLEGITDPLPLFGEES